MVYKRRFSEYIVREISWLRQYLNMSDEAKGEDALRQHPYIIDNYLSELEKLNDTEIDEAIEISEWEWLINTVKDNHPKVFKRILSDIVKNIFSLDIMDEEIPTWAYLKSPKVIKKQWLIHFTNDAENIAKKGFDFLVADISKLGLTTYMSKNYDRAKDGYGFSYLLSDYENYGKGGRGTEWKYGKEAVLFLGSGIRAYHVTDNEYQTIFKGDTVQNIIPIISGEELRYGVYNKKTNRLIYENDNMETIVEWVVKNYSQYRGVF